MSGRKSIFLAAGLFAFTAIPSRAEVVDVSMTGFQLQETARIAANPSHVYDALIEPRQWWSSDHTYSGHAENLSLDARAGGCWCEKLADGGSVQHLTVVFVDPDKSLRLRGALGPFQGLGVDGAMTIALKAEGDATNLVLTYNLGGYIKGGFGVLPKAADGVLANQIARLKRFIESGSPDAPK